MAKGCMAVPWGHLLDDSKLFSFWGFGFKANMDIKNLCSMIYLSKFLVEYEAIFGN